MVNDDAIAAGASPQPLSPRRRWAFRLVACGISASIGIVLLVYIQRTRPIYLEEPGHELTGHRYIYDSSLGWRNIPNWEATTFGRSLTINSKGLRDREYPYEKPPGTRRILVLGDSYAWGYGVDDDEIFTEVLETSLGKVHSNYEVLNAGVSGWGTDQQYLYLVDEGFRYSPDVVVLALFLVNDPQNNATSKQYGLHKPVFINTSLDLRNVPVPKPEVDAQVINSEADPCELTMAIVDKMAEACAAEGCRFLVMKFGSFLESPQESFFDEERRFNAMVSARPNLQYLDLDDRFNSWSISRQQLLEGNEDGHWNAFGHRQTAMILQRFLEKEGLLAPLGSSSEAGATQASLRSRPDKNQPNVHWWWEDVPETIRRRSLETGQKSNIRSTDYVGPEACGQCHEGNYSHWGEHRHRWMNAPAKEATVVGDFSGNAAIDYRGGQATFSREDDHYAMRLVRGDLERSYQITQTIGSRFFQYYVGRQVDGPEPEGHKIYKSEHVLPFGYWIDYRQWVPVAHIDSGREGEPSVVDRHRTDPFAKPSVVDYATHCSHCHTTPSAGDWLMRRLAEGLPPVPRGLSMLMSSYLSESHPDILSPAVDPKNVSTSAFVAVHNKILSLPAPVWQVTSGITCEACHYGSRRHAENPQEVMPEFFPVSPHLFVEGQDFDEAFGRNPENVNWACARCHTGRRFEFAGGMATWNSVEYSDAIKGACYTSAAGEKQLTCIHCHDPHTTIGRGWERTPAEDDDKCLSCHEQFRPAEQRMAHTHHPKDTPGSRCMNCHMPRINEGLQDMVRTHMIFSPTNADMIEANQPNACNMCHVDQTIDWTLRYLEEWYGETYSQEKLAASYSQQDRKAPAAVGWLQSPHVTTQMVAADVLTKASAQWALPELVRLLDSKYMLNRQFTRIGLEKMLDMRLSDYGYQFYMFRDERLEPLQKVWAALVNDGEDFQRKDPEPSVVDPVEENIRHYRHALRLKPNSYPAHHNLGAALATQGKLDEAVHHFRKALKIDPDRPETHFNLGNLLRIQGQLDEAIEHYQHVVQQRPEFVAVHYNLGRALTAKGRLDSALHHFREALRRKPEGDAELNAIAWLLAAYPEAGIHDPQQAIRLAERAAELTGRRSPLILNTLAAAYAAAGRFDQAVETAKAALQRAAEAKDVQLTQGIRQALALYQRNQPIRERRPQPK